jgi:hypothetical protein
MTLEFGKQKRLPFSPEDSKNAPILAAIPMHKVDTAGLIKFIVS